MEMNTEGQAPRNCLFIGDLSIFCTEKQLEEHFAGYGRILEVKIMKSEDKGRSLSYGFVKFSEPNDAVRAMQNLNNKLFQGRNLRIAWAAYRNKSGTGPIQPDSLETSPVHVSFISYQIRHLVTESSLRELFSRFGEVIDVSIKKSTVDRNINRQSGYGFIHFPITHDGISAAIRAVDHLQDNTVDEVNYKSSLSHKLQVFIEENRSFFSSNKMSHQRPNSSRTTTNQNAAMSHSLRNTAQRYYADLQPTMLSPSLVTHHPNYLSSYPTQAVPQQFAPVPTEPHYVVPQIVPMQHFVPPLPPSPTQPQYAYGGLPMHNFGMFAHASSMPSPAAVHASPQTYFVNDARYGCTPGSISSVDTFYDHLAGAILISPDFPSNKSPSIHASYGVSMSVPRNNIITTKNTSNLNLKKLRQGSLRKRMNQLEGHEVKISESSMMGVETTDEKIPMKEK